MRLPLRHQTQAVKKVLPRSLLGRSLLIMLIPLIMVQAVALQIFYGSHLEIVSRRFAAAIAGEIATTADTLQRFPSAADRTWALDSAWDRLELSMAFNANTSLPNTDLPPNREIPGGLALALNERLRRPFQLDWEVDPRAVLIRVQMADGVLDVLAPRKRLYAGTI